MGHFRPGSNGESADSARRLLNPASRIRNPPDRPSVDLRVHHQWRRTMSDFRNSDLGEPNDPLRRDYRYDEDARSANAAWGWIAGAVFVVIVLLVAFGIGHSPNSNT